MNPRRVLAAMVAAALAAVIIATLFLLQPTKPLTAQIAHYALAADGRQLTVTVAIPPSDTIESTSAQESTTTVKVIVLVSRRSGTGTANLLLVDIPLALASPLDGRTVVDANDRPVPVKVSAP